jgi:AcrR family transcriptional regulator
MSSDERRRRPTREEREAARREAKQIGEAAKAKAKQAAETAKTKAKEAAYAAAEEARGEAMEAAFAARREAHAARDRARGHAVPAEDNPFGLLWEAEDEARSGGMRGRGGHGGRGGRGRGSGLNRHEIVSVALQIAESDGPDAVSMRRIAKELGVGTMSLYHHVPTKDDLLDLMHDQVMGELLVPADELADDWQEALKQISRRTRDVYARHAWMVSGAWERPQFGPRAFAHIEQSLQIMKGIPQDQALRMLGVADDYVIGFVSRQVAEGQALARAGMSQEEMLEALRPYVEGLLKDRADAFPALAAFADDADWAQDPDERFEAGLNWLVAGMAMALRSDG